MAEKVHVRCGKLFQGAEEKVLENHTIVAEDGIVARIAPTKDVPKLADAKEHDFSRHFVIPGLTGIRPGSVCPRPRSGDLSGIATRRLRKFASR